MPRLHAPARTTAFVMLLVAATCCRAQQPADPPADDRPIRIVTWNIERMDAMFDQVRQPDRTRDRYELWDDEEDKLEVQLVLDMKTVDPDILVIQESCDQEMLERFNEKWLEGRYAYVKAFKSNSPGQWVAVMAKPGFEALEVRQYADEVDPVDDSRLRWVKNNSYGGGNPLFPRGPGFVKFKTPAGKTLWVGSTHIKSKGRNSKSATLWRARQIERLREICGELAKDTPMVYLGGDFNDNFGLDDLEKRVDRDAVAVMLQGEGPEKMLSPTRRLELQDDDLVTYHSKLKPFDPVLIDHVFLTPALDKHLTDARIIDAPIAYPASDHLPVVITLNLAP